MNNMILQGMEYKREDYKDEEWEIDYNEDVINKMYDLNLLREVKFDEFQKDIVLNAPPGDYFYDLFIEDIEHDGNKLIFVSLTDNKYNSMTGEDIKNLDLGQKSRFKVIVENGCNDYIVLKDKEGKYYYQRFF